MMKPIVTLNDILDHFSAYPDVVRVIRGSGEENFEICSFTIYEDGRKYNDDEYNRCMMLFEVLTINWWRYDDTGRCLRIWI